MNKYMFRYYSCLMSVGLLFTICDVPANAKMDNDLKEGNIISGIVTDDNGPLVNVNVIELDSNGRIVVHVVTDSQGRFSFALNDPTDKLKFTQIPYKEVEIPISEERYEIKMNVDSMHPSLSMVSVNDNPAIQNEILKEFEGLQLTNPVFFVGPTFELKGHGVLIFEDLRWAFERDRENLLLPRQDNYFLDYMLNNLMDGGGNNSLVDTVMITEIPHFWKIVSNHFGKELARHIKMEYRNLYGVVLRVREPDGLTFSEVHAMFFAKDKTEVDYAVDWIVRNLACRTDGFFFPKK